jgi:DNA-binding cell septation regulator SpoVG
MSSINIVVDIQLTNSPGAVKAHADVRIELPGGSLVLCGFAVIDKDGKPLWVGFPQKQGKIPGKYFPVVEADGEVRKQIADMILEAFRKAKAA